MRTRVVGWRVAVVAAGAGALIAAPSALAQWHVSDQGIVGDASGVLGVHVARGGGVTLAVANGDVTSGPDARRAVLARAEEPSGGFPVGFGAILGDPRFDLGSPADNEVVGIAVDDRGLLVPVDGGSVIAVGVEGADRGTGPGRVWAATRRAGTWSGKVILDAPRVVGPTSLRDIAFADDGNGRVVVAWVAGAAVHVAQFSRGAWTYRIVGSHRTVGSRGVAVAVNPIGDIAVAWSGARARGEEMKAYVAFAHRRGPLLLEAFAIGRRLPRAGRPPSVFVGDTGAIVSTWVCGAYLCARDLSPAAVRDRFPGSTTWGPLRRTRDVVRSDAPSTSFLSDGATVVAWRDEAGVARWTRRPFGGAWSAARAYATRAGGARVAMSPLGDGLLLVATPSSGIVFERSLVGEMVGPPRPVLVHPGVDTVDGHVDAVGATVVLSTNSFGSTGRAMRAAVRWQDRPQPSRLRVHRSGAVTFDLRFGGGPYEIRVFRPGKVRPRLIRLGVGRQGTNATRLPLGTGDVVVLDTGHGYLGRARARVG